VASTDPPDLAHEGAEDDRFGLVAVTHRAANRALGCDFFEGVLMKRANSAHQGQFRCATEECRGWVKHRFLA
jgi:hypothetical protein